MANRTTVSNLAPITPLVPAQVGQRASTQARNKKRTFLYALTARATVQVAVAPATSLRNRGSVWALVNRVFFTDNGTDKVQLDGRMLRFLSDAQSNSDLREVRADTPIATYALEETAFLQLAWPYAARPMETAYIEQDVNQTLEVSAVFNNDASRLFVVGPATVTITNFTVSVQQIYDDQRDILPLFLPYYREILTPVASASNDLPMYLRTNRQIAALAIQQDTSDEGEVPDIINALALRSDVRDYIGPGQSPYRDLQQESQRTAGGITADDIEAGYWYYNFTESGHLSTMVRGVAEPNLRIEADVQPSALGINSVIRVALLEMEQSTGLTVTEANRPFKD